MECGIFTGRNKDSEGIARAKSLGVPTSFDSLKAIIENPDCCDIVFDTTTAAYHAEHAAILKKLGKFTNWNFWNDYNSFNFLDFIQL